MLDLGLAAARKVLGVAIRGEAGRVEEADRRLHAELVLEGAHGHDAALGSLRRRQQ